MNFRNEDGTHDRIIIDIENGPKFLISAKVRKGSMSFGIMDIHGTYSLITVLWPALIQDLTAEFQDCHQSAKVFWVISSVLDHIMCYHELNLTKKPVQNKPLSSMIIWQWIQSKKIFIKMIFVGLLMKKMLTNSFQMYKKFTFCHSFATVLPHFATFYLLLTSAHWNTQMYTIIQNFTAVLFIAIWGQSSTSTESGIRSVRRTLWWIWSTPIK